MINSITTLFMKRRAKHEDEMIASYRILNLIAKCGKRHCIGEALLIAYIEEFVYAVMHQDPTNDLKMLPLSDNSASRRIDEMADGTESWLVAILQTTSFLMQLDESIITENNALLIAYVRFHNKKSELQEEMLFVQNLITDMRGLSIFTYYYSYNNNYYK